MIVHQLIAGDGTHCAYVVAADGRAVVVDPVPTVALDVADVLQRHELTLVACLETGVRAEAVGAREQRFLDLAATLGIEPGMSTGPAADELPWSNVPRGGPVTPWGTDRQASDLVLFELDGWVRELTTRGSGSLRWREALTLRGASAVVPLGDAVDVVALPTGDRKDQVAYRVGDSLLSGATLWSDGDAPPGPRTGLAQLELAEDLTVYPRRIGERRSAPLGDEREAWRYHQSTNRTMPPVDTRGFLPVVAGRRADPAPRVGALRPEGYRDLAPADALLHLGRFHTVVVHTSSEELPHCVPGARVGTHAELLRAASEWDADTPVLVASEMGERCRATARALANRGLEHVYRLVGGINLWHASGLPCEPAGQRRMGA